MTKSERNKKNYEKNRERILEKNRAYYYANRDRILAQKAAYDSREEIKLRKKLLACGVSA